METDINFEDDIKRFEAKLARSQKQLDALHEKRKQYDLATKDLRDSINRLHEVEEGNVPEEERGRRIRIKKLEVNEDTGRPARGARREQIEQLCRKIGYNGKPFRTIDVLNELEEVESGLTDGMKSYTYAVLTTLKEDGFVKKVSRGTWKLA